MLNWGVGDMLKRYEAVVLGSVNKMLIRAIHVIHVMDEASMQPRQGKVTGGVVEGAIKAHSAR